MVLELLNYGRAMDVTRSGAKCTVDETLGIPKPDGLEESAPVKLLLSMCFRRMIKAADRRILFPTFRSRRTGPPRPHVRA